MNNQFLHYIFFGSSHFSVVVLETLYKRGLVPSCIVTTPDKPQGRKLEMTPNIVKQWAKGKDIKVYDPAKLDTDVVDSLKNENCKIFIVASYGEIIPENIINIPEKKTLNIHPSLLPKYRGPSPLPSAMLDDMKHTGVTIMQIDKEMDHGPIVAQTEINIEEWPIYEEFEEKMASAGAELLVEILPEWMNGELIAKEQDHAATTYTKKVIKEDGLLNLCDNPYLNFRKIQAYHEWPQAYFIIKPRNRDLRVKITAASFEEGKLKMLKVIPEGGKEMSYEDFLRGYSNPILSGELPAR